MRILGLIPARGGSKGVPRKNVKSLNGKPLLEYTAEAALQCTGLARIILSTDCEKIAAIGRQCGLDTPFIRPAEYAQDTSPAIDTIQHAVRALEAMGEYYDAVCYLQPTNPLRKASTITRCIDAFIKTNADGVFTMQKVPHHFNPHWVFEEDAQGQLKICTGDQEIIPSRQALPDCYHREGSVYITKRDVLMNQGSLYGKNFQGVLIEDEKTINIDTPNEWERAERLMCELYPHKKI